MSRLLYDICDPRTTNLGVPPTNMISDPWLPWLYQYSVGGVFFFATIAVVLRSGALPLSVRANRMVLGVIVLGYFALATIHGVWIAALT